MKRILVCAALITWCGLASAVVYKWSDAQGKIQYGDRPPDGVKAEVVEMPGNHAAATAQTRNPSTAIASPPVPTAPANPTPRDPATQSDAAKKTVDDDVAQTRDKQCADAQDRYKRLIEGRKLYKPGADGQRQYLTSDEIDSERISAKHDVDAICNSPT